jgi:hypothetical protein
MASKHPWQEQTNSLSAISEYAEAHYYAEIEFMCSNILNYISQVMEMDVHGAMALNAVLCEQIVDEVIEAIKIRKADFKSYFILLAEKQQGGHDCSTCSGTCHMEHSLQLMNLKASHNKMESVINRLRTEGTPLRDIEYPALYAVVRQQMAALEKKLVELSLYEESSIIPGVIRAQKHINVHP